MCGIAGIHSPTSSLPELKAPLQSMQRALTHRGPDDQGIYLSLNNHCGLVHTRLSIVDLSAAGHQPMSTPDGRYWITFNGEIYNYRQLRQELIEQGESLLSNSDTEIILQLFARFGPDCVHRLRGMFAFAIWDERQKKLLIARDRLGIKPLYFYADNNHLIFASEVRAILATDLVARQIDPIALNQYLAYQSIPAPRSLIQNVQMLPPGSWMTIDADGTIEQHQYWDLMQNVSPEAHQSDKPTILRRTAELLCQATELHMVSDVPVGVFLSGGIDSSALVALIRELGHTPRTFSVIFAESNYDESVYARQIADRFRTDHSEIHLTESAMLEQMPTALLAMDQPTGDGVNTYVVSQAVRNAEIKVALSGLGGDEFFVGYASFLRLEKALRYLHSYRHLPVSARKLMAYAIELAGGKSIQASKIAAMVGSDGSLANLYPVTRQVLSFSKRQSLLSAKWQQVNQQWQDPYVALLQAAYANTTDTELFARISYAESRTYMHDVLMRDTDQMSMAHALEVRVPLLDHKLVEYLMGVPDTYKRPNGTPKSLLVHSLGDLLPREIVHRPKQGFTLPLATWMRGHLRAFCETRLSRDRIGNRGIFNFVEVQRLWNAFLNGSREVSWSRLWVLIALEEWLEQNQINCELVP